MERKVVINRQNISNGKSLADILFLDSDFSDVTLVSADNQHVSAHRAVLSANSSFLRSILFESCQQNTFLYMGMVDFEVLQSLVRFIYLGHCSIDSDKEGQMRSLALQLGVDMRDLTQDIARSPDDILTQDVIIENNLGCFEVERSKVDMDGKTQTHELTFGVRDGDSKYIDISKRDQIKEHIDVITTSKYIGHNVDDGINQEPRHIKDYYTRTDSYTFEQNSPHSLPKEEKTPKNIKEETHQTYKYDQFETNLFGSIYILKILIEIILLKV